MRPDEAFQNAKTDREYWIVEEKSCRVFTVGAKPASYNPRGYIMNTCTLPVGQLLLELRKYQDKLRAWVDLSEANSLLFVQDPAAALRAADLGISEDLIAEVEEAMQEIETFARRKQQLAA